MDFFWEHESELAEIYGSLKYIRRTNICIVFEEIYKLLMEDGERDKITNKIVEGYFMGKRMSNKISYYKGIEQLGESH